jgi:hypothetical protein
MASVCGTFFGHALEDLGRTEAEIVELVADGPGLGQFVVAIALPGDQLAAHLLGGQPGVQAEGAEAWIGLALAGHNIADIVQKPGQTLFGAKAPAGGEVIEAGDARSQLVLALADGGAAPAEFRLGPALPACAQSSNGTGHERTPRSPSQVPCRLDQSRSERLAQLDHLRLPRACLARSFYRTFGIIISCRVPYW